MSNRRKRRHFSKHIKKENCTWHQKGIYTGITGSTNNNSRRQREIQKQCQEEREIAKVLESFKQSFEPDRYDQPKAWVSAGSLNPETGLHRGKKRKLYLPDKAVVNLDNPPGKHPALKNNASEQISDTKSGLNEITVESQSKMMQAVKLRTRKKKKKTRNTIKALMWENELKKKAHNVANSMVKFGHSPKRKCRSSVPSLPFKEAVRKISDKLMVDERSLKLPEGSKSFIIKIPADKILKAIIDRLAVHVARDGMCFEYLFMSRERHNPNFDFLKNVKHSDHLYYRWRIISLVFGDSLECWRDSPFQLLVDGYWWIPPKMSIPEPNQQLSRRQDDSENMHSPRRGRVLTTARPLPETERNCLVNTLRQLTNKRQSIREAMAFCIDNSYMCREVVEIISESLTISQTKPDKKLARLYLLSDILHNSKAMVKNASAYRTEIKKKLRKIFCSIKDCYDLQERCSDESSNLKDDFKNSVKDVLCLWDGWNVFPSHFVASLRAIFLPYLDELAPGDEFVGSFSRHANNNVKTVEPEVPEILALALNGMVDDEEEIAINGEPFDDELDGIKVDAAHSLDREP